MLIAMTYSAILFICIVLGLAAGHCIFNLTFLALNTGEEEHADPCCSFMNADGTKRGEHSHSSSNATTIADL